MTFIFVVNTWFMDTGQSFLKSSVYMTVLFKAEVCARIGYEKGIYALKKINWSDMNDS